MNWFKKLVGKENKPEQNIRSYPAATPPVSKKPAPPEVPTPPKEKEELIRVFDKYGREYLIPRQEWRDKVLPASIKNAWDNPDELYNLIYSALNDGFISDVIGAAEQLYKIDHNPTRGACLWGVVLLNAARLDEAEIVFNTYVAKHGEDGAILTNLAKVYSNRDDNTKSEATLWHALEVDPNQDNGLNWYAAIHKERGGEEAAQGALRRVAALSGSWRAQLWLARAALAADQLEEAIRLYRESLSHVGKTVPTELLMQMSGDLGNKGKLQELLTLTGPHFDATIHGLMVGNNLIKAYLELGQFDSAKNIVNVLYAQKRPDWQQALSYWETEIHKAEIVIANKEPQKSLGMSLLVCNGPVWLPDKSPAMELFRVTKEENPIICFLGSTAEVNHMGHEIQRQLADKPGRMSRALPMFLAEQAYFGSEAVSQFMIPWISRGGTGFILCGEPWSDADAAVYVRQSQCPADYVVATHLIASADPWKVQLRFIRTIDATCLRTLNVDFKFAEFDKAIPRLSNLLLSLLAEHLEIESRPCPSCYQVPQGLHFQSYLLRLEQCLAIRCGTMEGVSNEFLYGLREIVDGNIQLCLSCPDNITTRVLLAQTLSYMKKVRADFLPEFTDRIRLLQTETPLIEPASSLLEQMIKSAISG